MSRRWVVGALGGLVAIGLGWSILSRRRGRFASAGLAWWLENPLADRLAGTRETLERLGLQPGQRVLEIGPGPGRLLIPAARRVLPGDIVGLDIEPMMIGRLAARAARAGVANLAAVVGDARALPFKPGLFDLVYLCAVLGEIPDRATALAQCYRVLKPGGRLSVTEIRPDPHYQDRERVCQLAEAAGFRLQGVQGNWRRYTATFERP